jgi:hypothetical protein
MPQASPPKALTTRNLRLDFLLLLSIVILVFFEFGSYLSSASFGPEFTQFYYFTEGRSFGEILHRYLELDAGWYRPTQFFLPYWIGEKFITWHNVSAWRAYELSTVIAVCGLIYWLVLTLLPGRRMAASAAALYFSCVPTIFAPLYELSAFDFIHIICGLLCAILFIIGYRSQTWRGAGWTSFALLSYVLALTSKEIAIVIPAYLIILSAVLYLYEPRTGTRTERLLREVKRLAPFWTMTVVYWVVHVRKIPLNSFNTSTDYRLNANWMFMLRNIGKYPLWFARIYSNTTDWMNQAAGYQNARNDLFGIVALGLVAYACFRLWRMGLEYQKYILLAVAWMAVFLLVPVYSGGYFWHGNLALCGYCMLFGVAVDWLATRIREQKLRVAFIAILIAAIVGLTRIDAAESLVSGIHSETYRINSTILTQPPVPLNRVSGPALIYVEDRKSQAWWSFGAGTLFHLVYLDRALHQVLVPAMSKVSAGDCVRWLKDPNAFFFRYDDNYRWHDASNEFRAFATAKASEEPQLPKITVVFPTETHAGVDFNVNGNASAIGVEGVNFGAGAEIVINGQRLPTVVGKDFVSTSVPREAYARPGTMSIQIRNADGTDSEPYLFRVLK